jgi:SAM-dependent methyltransferase
VAEALEPEGGQARFSWQAPAPAGSGYLFPRHPAEVDRLDVQHYALREELGTNHLAPVERPANILDVGCGTGQWAFELCAEFPEARVVGFDLEASKPERLANYRFVRGDLLRGLPFADERFDFVHQRLLAASGVPLKLWAIVVRDLVRVTRRGGWVELVEAPPELGSSGPATAHLFELVRRLGRSLGLDTTGIIVGSLDTYLRDAGLEMVQRRAVDLPIGEWGGRVGSLLESGVRAGLTRLCDDVFQAKFGITAEECRNLLRATHEEWGEYRTMSNFTYAYGRKPVGAA